MWVVQIVNVVMFSLQWQQYSVFSRTLFVPVCFLVYVSTLYQSSFPRCFMYKHNQPHPHRGVDNWFRYMLCLTTHAVFEVRGLMRKDAAVLDVYVKVRDTLFTPHYPFSPPPPPPPLPFQFLSHTLSLPPSSPSPSLLPLSLPPPPLPPSLPPSIPPSFS